MLHVACCFVAQRLEFNDALPFHVWGAFDHPTHASPKSAPIVPVPAKGSMNPADSTLPSTPHTPLGNFPHKKKDVWFDEGPSAFQTFLDVSTNATATATTTFGLAGSGGSGKACSCRCEREMGWNASHLYTGGDVVGGTAAAWRQIFVRPNTLWLRR